ncbi:MAG TPA: rRNA maturation RNase YbeY [Spirochaetota bacterium]|nr:rRNA maturation RNase YbeY [Spirochaetota bacterium]
MIDIDCELKEYNKLIEKKRIKKFAKDVLVELNYQKYDVSLFFSTPDTIKSLNNQYRKKDYVTDVLSFSQLEGVEKIDSTFLGDVVICIEKAKDQANELEHSLESELNFLILHGILHLVGYDHEVDNGEMDEIQKKIFFKLTGEDIE